MSKEEMEDDELENVGIMQGFLDQTSDEEDEDEEEYSSDEASAARILNRKPDSPEILMNNLRGDMRSIDARREELADLVGYKAATETPDEVLAMLQPVLAQQGGLGALPESQAMAQGPQPPMPPPPGGMGAPPMGAPLPPPGGVPSPFGDQAAALMASAGSPPGGGSAAMTGPDGMPIPPEGVPPIAMRDGGLVQRFNEGSDEEGVTPATMGMGDSPMLYSPELVAAARQQAMRLMTQPPREVPSLESLVNDRTAQYQSILGDSSGMSKAGMLFDIAQAGLNLAANRGPGGEVLRGSPVSRFAGAFSALPGNIQKRLETLQDAQRQMKVLALQASEKDRAEIMDLNAKLAAQQSNLLSKVLTADAQNRMRGSTNQRLTGNWEMGIFLRPGLLDRYSRGETTADEDNEVESAAQSYTAPKYIELRDPYGRGTGKYDTSPGASLPKHVMQAMALRNSGGPPAGRQVDINPAQDEPGYVAPPAVSLPPGVEEAVGTTPQPDPLLPPPTTTPDGRPISEVPVTREEVQASPMNLWSNRTLIAGPVAAAYSFVSKTPGLGDPLRRMTIARKNAELFSEELVEAFLKSTQNSVTEQKMLNVLLATDPAAMTDPEVYGSFLISLGSNLESLMTTHKAVVNNPRAFSPERLSDSSYKLLVMQKALKGLGLPKKVYSEAELSSLPEGTEVLWQGWQPARVNRSKME